MAILKSVVNVNNGNTGWTKKDVVDALETVFANLGWHGGTAITGAVQNCKVPGTQQVSNPEELFSTSTTGEIYDWRKCGGPPPAQASTKARYFHVTNNGTSSYTILEEVVITSATINLTNNTFSNTNHPWQTGDEIHWTPGETDSTKNVGGLTLDTVYYAIKVNDNTFKIATTAEDAATGTEIDLTSNLGSGITSFFRRKNSPTYNNPTIYVLMGDTLNFNINDTTSGGTFNLISNSDNYDPTKKLDSGAFSGVSYQAIPSGNGTASISWDTAGWRQSENEIIHGLEHPGYSLTWGSDGLVNYIYANSINPDMKGEIVILPRVVNRNSQYKQYWKYTVPASGNRSELKLRVWRRQIQFWPYVPFVIGITVHNISSGWSEGDTFTIPGNLIGGTTPANDITFGVNTAETFNDAYNGIPSVTVTNIGAGSTFYQKHDLGYYGVLKNINDSTKKYGTTYYTFAPQVNNNYILNINCGSGWHWLNRYGTTTADNSDNSYGHGNFSGRAGLDYKADSYNIYRGGSSEYMYQLNYATSATPTAYPLSIRVYRAQSPQDNNFAIIQFTQTINESIIPYGTFTLHRGNSFGSNVFDLNNVFLDTITVYGTGSRDFYTYYISPGYRPYSAGEPSYSYPSKARLRASSYGWLRDRDSYYSDYFFTRYTCNIDTDVDTTNNSHITIYYRNSTYDTAYGNSIGSAADYYKPIKGIPIDNNIVPCPYYMPDDFVILQVSTSPGLTQFRPGDTVTISSSEIYEIILAGYQTQQNSLDNINNNSAMGMLFMARIV